MPSSKPPEKTNLLALDLATQTGFAMSTKGLITCWEEKYPADLGQAFYQFEGRLQQLFGAVYFDLIIAEAPVPSAGKTNQQVLLRAHGMHAILRKVCAEIWLPLTFVNCGTWRKAFIGAAKAPKEIISKHHRRQWLKQAVKEECNRRGWFPKTDDAADALGILSYALSGFGDSDGSSSNRDREKDARSSAIPETVSAKASARSKRKAVRRGRSGSDRMPAQPSI